MPVVEVNRDDDLDQTLEALANPHRREIVQLLALQPWAIGHLARHRGLTLPAMSKHIGILERAGLVQRRKQGRTNFLTLNRQPLVALQTWAGQFHTYWGAEDATYANYAQHLDATGQIGAEQ